MLLRCRLATALASRRVQVPPPASIRRMATLPGPPKDPATGTGPRGSHPPDILPPSPSAAAVDLDAPTSSHTEPFSDSLHETEVRAARSPRKTIKRSEGAAVVDDVVPARKPLKTSKTGRNAEPGPVDGSNPRLIKEYLDQYVIGQPALKRTISVALFTHYSRLNIKAKPAAKKSIKEDVVVEKSNVLLIGPTGSGKTLIARTTANLLNVPFSMNDATPFTQAGYVGEDVENADFDVERAERGIVFIDEIDKIARRTDSGGNQRDVSGEGVQQGLLRMLEGTTVTLSVKPGGGQKRGPAGGLAGGETFTIDTSNILFVCSGAFVGLEKIVNERVASKG
ncbi:P-loop containing nucleoside triphosphate hydrolase protein, partial [Blyttiomyces helicus]